MAKTLNNNNKQAEEDFIIISLLVVILLCFSTSVGARKFNKQSTTTTTMLGEFTTTPLVVEQDGICKSMVETRGYICEEHQVTTKDGYILSIQRIPQGRQSSKAQNKIPVLLQHGVLMDGITWLLNPADQSLGFILADNGFDVWIANTRGTNYSRRHTTLTPTDPSYWDWSWDELVAYDLPATVHYVYNQTAQKLHYVGHSLGTLIAFAAFSQKELVDTIRSAALLSPIAYLAEMSSVLAKTAAQSFLAEDLYRLGIKEFAPRGEAVAKLLEEICKKPDNNCSDLLTSFTGPNCCLNSSWTDIFLEHEPQSTATKNMIHLAQMIREGTIEMYDYGNAEENMKHYGESTAPAYEMGRIPEDFPLFVSYGGQDYLSDVNDVHNLLKAIENHNADKIVVQYIEDYAHADFVFGVDANQLVYPHLIAFFKLH